MTDKLRPVALGSLASRYLIALAVTALAILLQIWLAPNIGGGRYLMLIGAIVISATYSGFGPALLSIALSSAAVLYLFVLPVYARRFVGSGDAIQLAIIDTFMILLSWIIAAHRAEMARLRDARGRDLQEMANRVEAERRRLADIVSSVPGVVWESHGNPNGQSQGIDYVSEHVTRMLGYSVEEWLATPNFWLTIVHPDDREMAARHSEEHFAAGGFQMDSFRWLTKDGRAIWVESHSMVVNDDDGKPIGMRGVTLDLTARRRAEESLRFLARVSELVTSSLDANITLETAAEAALPILGELCVIDVLDGASIRRAAVRHVDPSLQDAVRLMKTYSPRVDHPYGPPAAIRSSKPEVLNELPPEELAKRGDDEAYRDIIRRFGTQSYMVVPLIAQSGTIGALTVSSSQKNRYDDADRDLAQLFARRVALAVENAQLHTAAVEANRAKDEFLATVSHELRTPMTATLGWVRMLTQGSLDEETAKVAMESIDRSTQAQARLIEDILDVSSIISGKFRLDVVPVDLCAVITSAIETLQPAAMAKQITIDIDLDSATPVLGDANRLQQIVWNLLSNAIKFVPRGGHIAVRLARGENAASVIVSDDGPGIEPVFLPHVFERFRQADSGNARAHGGLGLGLAIVRHLAELHGGSATVASEGRGHGATFTVELPLDSAQRDDSQQRLPVFTPPSSPPPPAR
ncbi:MAG TPA: ATP-binding protein [Thermoanaerobaculia bacterium]|nr:ATP-binding protein [Thermoanaerobaculia bacterium]